MSKITLLFMLMLSLTFYAQNNNGSIDTAEDTTACSNTLIIGEDNPFVTLGLSGQSFTATKTGKLTSVSFDFAENSTGTLNIFNGHTTTGTPIHTQAFSVETGQQEILITESIDVVAGQQYTIQTNAPCQFNPGATYEGGSSFSSHVPFSGDLWMTVVFIEKKVNILKTDIISSSEPYTWIDGITYTESNTTAKHITESCSGDTITSLNLTITGIADQNITAPESICLGKETSITLDDSELGVRYSLRDNTDNTVIGNPVYGNSEAVSLKTGLLTEDKTYNIYAESAILEATSLNFDGINDRVLINTNDITVSNTYTVEAWVKPYSLTKTMTILSTRINGANSFDFKLQNGNLIHGDIGNGADWITTSADATFNYNTNEWIHIAYVVTKTGYTIYANGVSVGSGVYNGTPLLTNADSPIVLGGYTATIESFEGQIDEVRVWSTARTAEEIQNNYNISVDPSQTGLVAYYDFNNGTDSGALSDLTTNNYNGTLSSFDTATAWLTDPVNDDTTRSKQLSSTASISVTDLDNATFAYKESSYNTNETDPTPTITGLTGGVFSTSSSDLIIDTTSGAIDLDKSLIGSYTITYTTNGTCSNSSTFDVTITGTSLSTSDIILDKVNIYNSSKNQLIIKDLTIKANLIVYSLSGKQVVRTTVVEENNLIKIDLPTLDKGVYIVRLISDSGFTINKKIVLE